MAGKIAYRTGTTEQHLAVPRERAWAALLEVLDETRLADALGGGCVESPLSTEPPWRRVSALAGGPARTERCEVTFTLRDDGPECHLTWSFLVHPGAGDADLATALEQAGGRVLAEVAEALGVPS